MDKVKFSNRINRIGCGDELLYCTRVYVNARLYGGAWIPMEWFLNTAFFLLRGERQHIRASYLWEMRSVKKQTKPNLQKERKKEMDTKEWEKSFLPLGEGGIPPDEVSCDYCRATGSLARMLEVRKYAGNEPINLRFCGEGCSHEYYLDHLRGSER